ncbi:mechanosensitive ion channel [Sphingomonas cannabina]|uniref:mechanosensitive ion channel family protein n=1 Tax=Sphingomonas cannabina TaxID=2899123 RepID=UPI001F28BACE|nr:mechanosensitive ion channel domain-containing protein [Sphingomonas cannabina]UIJ45306.1 mechanosensitive ion channel [Sphingomonas cannabina]
MSRAGAWLAAKGLAEPTPAELGEAGIALALVVAALALGWLAGRTLGPRATALWTARVGEHGAGVGKRLCAIVRHGTAALLLAILSRAWPWHPLADAGIGVALGAAGALAMVELLRGVRLSRWIAWSVAAVVFTALLRHAVGGLAPITTTLDAIAVEIGSRRLSLLTLVSLLVAAVLLYALVRLVNRATAQALEGARGLDPTQRLLAQKLIAIAAVVVAFFFAVDLLGIDLTTFAVFSGAMGLAIGFGLQKTVGNLIAGIILLMDRSIKPGDVIVVGDSFGWVNKIGVRAVSVVTRDGKEHLIPNEILMTQEVENWSYTDTNVRVRIPVRVAYDCDLELAQALMLRAAKESPRVLDTPPSNVWVTAFGEYAVEHDILVWINDPQSGVGNVRSDVLNRLWRLFKEHGIVVPYPRSDVRIAGGRQVAAGLASAQDDPTSRA